MARMLTFKTFLKSSVSGRLAGWALGALLTLQFGACHHEEGPPADMAVPTGDMVPFSCCGHPGDPGNKLGVGKYCTDTYACQDPGTSAPICSAVFYPEKRTFFCTKQCDAPDAGTRGCGEGATCVKDSSSPAWGCVPTGCLNPDPATGCMN